MIPRNRSTYIKHPKVIVKEKINKIESRVIIY